MCGRYASTASHAELVGLFKPAPGQVDPPLPADFNVAPTKQAPVVLSRPPRDDREGEPVVQLRNLT